MEDFVSFHVFVLFALFFDLGLRKWGRGWDQIRFPQMIIQPRDSKALCCGIFPWEFCKTQRPLYNLYLY